MSETEQPDSPVADTPTEAYIVLMDGQKIPGIITDQPERDDCGRRRFTITSERPLLPWELINSSHINMLPPQSSASWVLPTNHLAPKPPERERPRRSLIIMAVLISVGLGALNLWNAFMDYYGSQWLHSGTMHRVNHVLMALIVPLLFAAWITAVRVARLRGDVINAQLYNMQLTGTINGNLHNVLARLCIASPLPEHDPQLEHLVAWYNRPSAAGAVADGPEDPLTPGRAGPLN